jgi:anti-anti-sigma factor
MSADLLPLGDVPVARNASRLKLPSIARRAPRDCGPKPLGVQAPEKAFALAVGRAMGVVVVTAHGHLGAAESDVLQTVLVDLIEGQGNMKVVMDVRDVSGFSPSSLEVLVAATDAAAQLGGELTFSDPSDAGSRALEAVGLGDAITLARKCGLRALAPPPRGEGDGAARRAAMAEHPAGTGSERE